MPDGISIYVGHYDRWVKYLRHLSLVTFQSEILLLSLSNAVKSFGRVLCMRDEAIRLLGQSLLSLLRVRVRACVRACVIARKRRLASLSRVARLDFRESFGFTISTQCSEV